MVTAASEVSSLLFSSVPEMEKNFSEESVDVTAIALKVSYVALGLIACAGLCIIASLCDHYESLRREQNQVFEGFRVTEDSDSDSDVDVDIHTRETDRLLDP